MTIAPSAPDRVICLSYRQRQILEMLAGGCTAEDMARQLYVAESTVKRIKDSLFSKLGAHNAAQAVAIAYREGLLAIDPAVAEAADLLRSATRHGYRLALVAWGGPNRDTTNTATSAGAP